MHWRASAGCRAQRQSAPPAGSVHVLREPRAGRGRERGPWQSLVGCASAV
ncbi:hypothetical protein [Pseudomonas xanthosomatis]